MVLITIVFQLFKHRTHHGFSSWKIDNITSAPGWTILKAMKKSNCHITQHNNKLELDLHGSTCITIYTLLSHNSQIVNRKNALKDLPKIIAEKLEEIAHLQSSPTNCNNTTWLFPKEIKSFVKLLDHRSNMQIFQIGKIVCREWMICIKRIMGGGYRLSNIP
jgi:hypothetical protein